VTQSDTTNPAARYSDRRKMAIFAVMAFGQFMALLDIQIVAASLGSIQAGLSAGPDEIAWVQTAYLMAEIVMIPLAAFLSQAISTRWLFTASAALFTVASLMCGLAWDINSMIAFRALQGFVGGAMIPTVFATGYMIFEGPKRAMVPAILGVVSTLAPTLGPSVGGWITDVADWRWIFFINLVPGLGIAAILPFIGKVDEAQPAMLKQIDWLHVASLAIFLGGLQFVLEEGPRHEWFTDVGIQSAAWLSFVGAVVFFERSFFSKMPVLKLTPFRHPTFTLACVLNLVIGLGLYGATYLMPVFLGRVRGFSSLQIGGTVFVAGLTMALAAPIAARLSTRVDNRYVLGAGLSIFALGLWLISHLTAQWGFAELFIPQCVRGFAILLCIVPSVGMAMGGVAPSELRYASGLFNLMRNLGGALGIAVINTLLGDFTRLHVLKLSEAMGHTPDQAKSVFAGLSAFVSEFTPDPGHATELAQSFMARMVGREALTLAFDDVFRLMALCFVLALVIVPFCKPPPANAPPVSEH